jgi:hypothetical protein
MDGRSWEEVQQNATVRKRLAKLMARDCFRNTTELEDLHAEDRFDDNEMKALMMQAVDQCYDFLIELCSPHGDEIINELKRRDAVPEWNDPEMRIF